MIAMVPEPFWVCVHQVPTRCGFHLQTQLSFTHGNHSFLKQHCLLHSLRVVWPEQAAVAKESDGKCVLILYEEHGGLNLSQKRPPRPSYQIYELTLFANGLHECI